MHGGHHAANRAEKEKSRNLMLTKYKAELLRLGNSDQILNLRDEIAVLRMMLEKYLNGVNSDADLFIAAPAISDMILKIERTVSSCHKIEERTGQLLSIEQLGAFAVKIIDVVNEVVTDSDAKEKIAAAILTAVKERNED
jgi:hypothetical protein